MCPSDDTTREAVTAAKRAAREYARAARCELDLEVCLNAAQALAVNLVAMAELPASGVICSYRATPEEIDPAPAVAVLRAHGFTAAYPRIEAPEIGRAHV